MPDRTERRRRGALFLFFFLPGVAMSSWITRTPDIRDQLDVSTGRMGLVLFGLSVGSMSGLLCAGRLVAYFGTRPVIKVGSLLIPSGMLLVGAGATVPSPLLVAAGLCAFGAGVGAGEVALNVDGADVERVTGKAVLPLLHGGFSLGTVIGGLLGMAATAMAFPVLWHLVAAALVAAGALPHALRGIPSGVGLRGAPQAGAERGSTPAPWKDRGLLLIGAIILAMALAEGAANDWLPLLMVDGHGLGATAGSLVYVGFAAAMTAGRFGGEFFLERFGRVAVMRASAVSAAVGLVLVVFSDNAAVASGAVLFWGLGASLGFPVALSAAGDSGPDQTARVSLVATIGYVAFLVGPPGLGFLGDHYGLRPAMTLVLAFVVAAVFLAPAAGGRARGSASPHQGAHRSKEPDAPSAELS
ncbi:MFS transporter [Streptomyces sp. NPDC006134]|uniref:MFS transporter n=1 Tax=Streptomyces sp. NPDC006134 TaxID=3154467 RepID=UPI0033D3AD3B